MGKSMHKMSKDNFHVVVVVATNICRSVENYK